MIQSIPITLDKERTIRYGIGTQKLIEKKHKKGFMQILSEDMTNTGVIVSLLQYGLRHEDDSLTESQVTEILDNCIGDNITFAEIVEKIADAVSYAIYGKPASEVADKKK